MSSDSGAQGNHHWHKIKKVLTRLKKYQFFAHSSPMLYTWFNYEITIYTLVKLGMIDLSEEILIGNTARLCYNPFNEDQCCGTCGAFYTGHPGKDGPHDDVIKWTLFPCYWPFVRELHQSPVNSTHKGQWRGASMFSLIWAWINGWVNNREAGDLRRHRAHYDVIIMTGNRFNICKDVLS